MKPYNPDALCPMCGHAEISTSFCTKYWKNDLYIRRTHTELEVTGKTGLGPGHLDRCCKRCAFEWVEATVGGVEAKQ